MIAVVTCTCGGAEGMARTVLKNGGLSNWLEIPIAQGKNQTKYVLDTFKSKHENNSAYKALCDYVEKKGRYVVLIGEKGKTFAWADVARGTLQERLDAEILVKEFA